jgi:cell division protease FtsH
MVKAYGMSDKLGQISFERDRRPMFLQAPQSETIADYSEETSREIDCEVRRIIDEQYGRVKTILASQEPTLREAAGVLLGKETISGEELKAIIAQSKDRSAVPAGNRS